MLEAREEADLTNKAKLSCLGGRVGVEDFERDLSFVFEVSREIYRRECSLPYLTLDFVMSAERGAQRSYRVERRCHGRWIRCVVGLGRLEHSTLFM
jgi:hypothetical protein